MSKNNTEETTMKQLEPHSKAIGENTFYIRPLPAFKAANMSGELATLILPLLTGLAPARTKITTC